MNKTDMCKVRANHYTTVHESRATRILTTTVIHRDEERLVSAQKHTAFRGLVLQDVPNDFSRLIDEDHVHRHVVMMLYPYLPASVLSYIKDKEMGF